jgi:hypothetical protein
MNLPGGLRNAPLLICLLVHLNGIVIICHLDLPADPGTWPLGMLGEDPRTNASSRHGKDIVDFEVNKMRSVIRSELEKLP